MIYRRNALGSPFDGRTCGLRPAIWARSLFSAGMPLFEINFPHYLRAQFQMGAGFRSFLEFPRESQGFAVVFYAVLLGAATERRLFALAATVTAVGMTVLALLPARLALGGGGTLLPTVEIGVRHDGGHVETGYRMDLGGALAWSDPALGLSAQVAARGLLTGTFDCVPDLGLSGSLARDPDPAPIAGRR